MSEVIFIHIPKTGGTTINTSMQGSFWQTTPGFNYRHILSDKSSNSGDIFNPIKFDGYRDHKIFMMLRHPVDRIVSEYYFIKERNEFMDLLKPKPKDFEAYVRNRQTQNYMTAFLKGQRMYSTVKTTEDDLEDVLEAIDVLPVYTGIFEHFADSLAYFSDTIGIKWNKVIDVKRMTLRRPKLSELSNEMIQLIEECNSLDMELYNYCLDRFNEREGSKKGNFSFRGDKYDHVIAYAARACLYEFCLENKSFIKQNFSFFKDLTFHLVNELKITDGKVLTTIWNQTFLDTFNKHFPNSELGINLSSPEALNEDPLEHAYNIGQIIDAFFIKPSSEKGKYCGMILDKSLIQSPAPPRKKGLFSRFFDK